jgi:hypothetical protein
MVKTKGVPFLIWPVTLISPLYVNKVVSVIFLALGWANVTILRSMEIALVCIRGNLVIEKLLIKLKLDIYGVICIVIKVDVL